jgi:anaerobic magnesium-protoporphyrin IX monomethyl ester cyclase
MKIRKIQLITTRTGVGKGANDGIYPPGGLLTIGSAILRELPEITVTIHDQHHEEIVIDPEADLIGIQVASTLCYKNSLAVAEAAKAMNKTVVLGGPHVTALYQQIMRNQPIIDYAIRGKGERPLVELVKALTTNQGFGAVPSLSWRDGTKIVHNPAQDPLAWRYDDFTPLPLHLLASGAKAYWQAFCDVINPNIDAVFLLFTHFGCGYRQIQVNKAAARSLPVVQAEEKTNFCSFCSLDDPPLTRDPQRILEEIHAYVTQFQLPKSSRIHLKCYGDNIGPQRKLLEQLAQAIEACPWWTDYCFSWTFYCQSSYLTEHVAQLLKRVGTSHLYIGFDGADDKVQHRNGLGTNLNSHRRAVALCKKYGMLIQAGSVVGLAGETQESLDALQNFLLELVEEGVLERINSAVLFIIPGTPAYEMLAAEEPQIRDWDVLPTTLLRQLFIKHFCRTLTLDQLEENANKIDLLSPGPHASMGYVSSLLREQLRPAQT